MDKEPVLSGLFVTAKFHAPSDVKALEAKGDDKAGDEETYAPNSALEAARDMLLTWRELWEADPQLLASSVFRVRNVVCEHAFEHMAVLHPLRSDANF